MKRVLVAPTAFKGTLGPRDAAEAIAAGLRRRDNDVAIDLAPVSDGGDGFLECLTTPLGASRRSIVVRGPVHAPVAAGYGMTPGGLAVVEAAQAVGMARLAAGDLDPLHASSGGLGEVLAEARQAGARRFMVGLGGSASTDGGTGMARALGYRFLDAAGRELPEGGGSLHRLARIDAAGFDPAWLMLDVEVACDVDNPLVGTQGTAGVFAPQKGAGPAAVALLEEGMAALAAAAARDLGVEIAEIAHGGAAGGLGAGMVAFLGGRLRGGAALVIDALGISARLGTATAMVTGEGRLDAQSMHGKAPVEVGRMARATGVRATALVGATGPGWETALADAFDEVRVVAPGSPAPRERVEAARRLADAAALLDL